MKYIKHIVLALCVIFLFLPVNQFADDTHDNEDSSELIIFTEQYPPFNYMYHGQIRGSSTEIIQSILRRLKIRNYRIVMLDWDLAYKFVQYIPNSIIYSITRTKEREDKFKWVGPIATNYWYLFASSKNIDMKNVTVRTLDEAKKYNIAVQKNGALENYLFKNGFTNVIESLNFKDAAEDLLNNKLTLWPPLKL